MVKDSFKRYNIEHDGEWEAIVGITTISVWFPDGGVYSSSLQKAFGVQYYSDVTDEMVHEYIKRMDETRRHKPD